jgi:uncharacterized protein YodC (DUF2158 family)
MLRPKISSVAWIICFQKNNMANIEYKVGNVVTVQGQFVLMTVMSIGSSDGGTPIIHCAWFDKHDQLQRDRFTPELLNFVRN